MGLLQSCGESSHPHLVRILLDLSDCQNSTQENNFRYKSMKSKAKKTVSKSICEKAEETLADLENCPNWMLRPAKILNIDGKEDDI